MATTQSVRTSNAPNYRDLVSELTEHSWMGVFYAVGSIVFLYVLGFTSTANALFAAAEVPAVCVVTAVLRHDRRLHLRVPLVWSLTAAFIWAIPKSVRDPTLFSWPNEIAASTLTLLFGYWLARAVRGSIIEFKREGGEPSPATIVANLSAIWGATLIVVYGASLVIQPFLIPIIEATTAGSILVRILAAAQRVSLWNWLPSGLLLFGLALFASLRFKDDPYRPRNYQEILSINLPSVLNALFAALRVPVWLCVIVVGFLIHFIKQVWLSFEEFFDKWIGRIILIFVSLIVPTAFIFLAHFTVLTATEKIAEYLSGHVVTLTGRVALLLTVHAYILLGMCLYLIAVTACALEIIPLSVRQIPKHVKHFIVNTGFPAGNAVGRSFSLYGILFIAVPIASMLPGGPGVGLFSIVYGIIVMLTASIVIYLKIRSDAGIKALHIEVISLRLFEAGLPADSHQVKSYSNNFVDSEVRSILWELSLRHAAPSQKVPLDITAEWTRTTGVIVAKRICRGHIESGSTGCIRSDGLGSNVLGQFWIPGTYNLKLYVGNTVIAHDQFNINPTKSSRRPAPEKTPSSWYQRHAAVIGLIAGLVILAILELAGSALVHVIKPHPAMWLRIVLFVWAAGVALVVGFLISLDAGPANRATRDAVLMTIGLTCAFGVVLLVVAVAGKLGLSVVPTSNTVKPELGTFESTHWRGRVGQSPASLDIFSLDAAGIMGATVRYAGIAEDLLVTKDPDGTLVLRGKGYRRESGAGPFSLDVFYGRVSPDGTQIQGSLMDGSRHRGEWSVTKFTPGIDVEKVTEQSLSPSPSSSTQWQGIVGNWPAMMEISPRKTADQWVGRVTYRNVTENFSILVKEDGSVLLVGTGYQRLSGEGAFSLDTFYGQLSDDGQHLKGLRIDTAQTRGLWNVSRVTDLPLENRPLADQTMAIKPSFDCAKAKTPIEIDICADGNLASLEISMADAYHNLLNQLAPAEKADFRREHLDWFKKYQESCNLISSVGTSNDRKECIARALADHARELQARINARN